jgi:hypothetical protein
MADYYKILGLKESASAAEIKSAYRRLARERHPDVNGGSQRSAREFAAISLAYRTLGDPERRTQYDAARQRRRLASFAPSPNNPYLARMRTVAAQARMDRAMDRLFALDRSENLAFQRVVYPIVALLFSAFLAALLRPYFWRGSGVVGRCILCALFIAGLSHLWGRLNFGLSRISAASAGKAKENGGTGRHTTPLKTIVTIALAAACSFAIGLFISSQVQYVILQQFPFFFDSQIHLELLLYPPICVLIIDTLHSLALRLDI